MSPDMVIIPNTPNKPSAAEIEVAYILARHSQKPVEIITPRMGYKLKTPDIIMDGNMWEIKSTGSIKHTSIKDHLKRAIKQSKYIVIDTRRVKVSDEKVIATVKHVAREYPSIRKLLCITPRCKVVAIIPLR